MKRLDLYLIQGEETEENEYLYWSNDLGWVDKDSATKFTKDEINKLNMPLGFTGIVKVY